MGKTESKKQCLEDRLEYLVRLIKTHTLSHVEIHLTYRLHRGDKNVYIWSVHVTSGSGTYAPAEADSTPLGAVNNCIVWAQGKLKVQLQSLQTQAYELTELLKEP